MTYLPTYNHQKHIVYTSYTNTRYRLKNPDYCCCCCCCCGCVKAWLFRARTLKNNSFFKCVYFFVDVHMHVHYTYMRIYIYISEEYVLDLYDNDGKCMLASPFYNIHIRTARSLVVHRQCRDSVLFYIPRFLYRKVRAVRELLHYIYTFNCIINESCGG